MNENKVALGLGIIGLALLPTPDDLTVVSPVVQILAGAFFIGAGLLEKK